MTCEPSIAFQPAIASATAEAAEGDQLTIHLE